MKPIIFIGSSSETAHIAKYVKSYFENDFECIVWKDHFFEVNRSTYDSLTKKAMAFDYAIFIGGQDDKVFRMSEKKTKIAPRDNIYLEFGLYAGILSPERSYFLIDKKCSIASDLLGLTILEYDNPKSIKKSCDQIREKIKEEQSINRIQLLPSTSLAVSYFRNFLSHMESALLYEKTIEVDSCLYPIEKIPQKFEIIIPDTVDTDWTQWWIYYKKKQGLKETFINSQLRKMGVTIDYDALIKNRQLHLVDVPLILQTSFHAVDLVLGTNYIGSSKLSEAIKRKEMRNFVLTLKNLIKSTAHMNNIIEIKTIHLPIE